MIAENAPKGFGIRDFVSYMASKNDDAFADAPPKRVTCRIPPDFYFRLQHLAEHCGETSTGLAEELLCFAIKEAWDELGLDYEKLVAQLASPSVELDAQTYKREDTE